MVKAEQIPDEVIDALRERVARAMYGRWRTTRPNAPIFDNLYQEARESELLDASVAIAICFEEAARVADHYSNYDGGRAAAALRAYGSKQIILPLPQKETSE